MLSRPKLVQDWNRRLAAAEAEGAQKHSLKWLYQMRVRLYRFLLSCYRQGDWRADKPSNCVDDTLADVPHGETTTVLDCPLDGKPAKHAGKMQAVLKSVSAAQDHPPEAGPLLGGIAADEWVVAVSVRDKLKMAGCQELLRQYGIASKWTLLGEIKVRLFDLERATQIIRKFRDSLRIRAARALPWMPAILHPASIPVTDWPVRLAILIFFLAPIYAIFGLVLTQCVFAVSYTRLLQGPDVLYCFLIWYFAVFQINILVAVLHDIHRRRNERQEARQMAEGEKSRLRA